jgi:hypothetical protein
MTGEERNREQDIISTIKINGYEKEATFSQRQISYIC